VERWLLKNICKLDVPYTISEEEFESWLASCTGYNEERKRQLRLAWDEVGHRLPSKDRCVLVKCFIKAESYDEVKEARWIMSRTDRFKVIFGPMMKHVERALYQSKYFIKHVPVPDRPRVIESLARGDFRFFQTDFTAFESHFIAKFMRLVECKLYAHVLGESECVKFGCDVICGLNKLRTRARVDCRLLARRMSGEMCTSAGNGFSNLMLFLFIMDQKGYAEEEVDGLVEGDDGLFASPVEVTAADYLKLGWTIKIEEVDHPYHASFCGMLCADDGTIIKDPKHVFRTFGWTSSFIHAGDKIMWSLLKSKALSLAYEMPQCPILGALARAALNITREVEMTHEEVHYREIPREFAIEEFRPSQECRAFFARRFSISVEAQLEVEKLIMAGKLDQVMHYVTPGADDDWYTSRYIEEY